MDVKQIRKHNLAALVGLEKKAVLVANKVGTDAAYLSQILGKGGKAKVGDDLARRIEDAYGLGEGGMDRPFYADLELQSHVEKILTQDGWEVDHVFPKGLAPDKLPENVLSLCNDCHIDMVLHQGDRIILLEVKRPESLQYDSAALKAAQEGKAALITSDDPDTVRQQLDRYLSLSSNTQPELKRGQFAPSNAEEAPALGNARRVPVVGTAQLGDNGYWAELQTPVGFGDGYVEVYVSDRNAYAVRCRGDSMKPRIKDGEFVVVEPNLVPSPGDEVLVRAKDGRVMVKELLYVRDEVVHLHSVNETHGRIAIPLSEIDVMHLVTDISKRIKWRPD